jgi:hypothetical protein
MFDHKQFDYFIQLIPTQGDWGFSNYPDLAGNTYQAYLNFNENNHQDSKRFYVKWSVRERTLRAPKDRDILVSINGDRPKKMKLKEFIANSPFTEGSKNLRGVPTIKLFDEVKDATTGIERKELRLKAGNAALEIRTNPERLAELARMIGCFRDEKDVQLNRVLEFADQDPEQFLKYVESPDTSVASLLKKGVDCGALKKKGKMIMWEKESLGADFDDAVSNLMKDKDKAKAVRHAVDKVK